MKKCLILMAAVLIFGISSLKASSDLSNLFDAIHRSNVSKVKSLLKKEHENITEKEKGVLLKSAKDGVKLRMRKISIFKSGRDVLRLMFGSGLSFTGTGIFLVGGGLGLITALFEVGPNKKVSSETLGLVMGSSAAGGTLNLVGLWQMYRGWTLYSAYKSLNQARVIEAMIENLEIR